MSKIWTKIKWAVKEFFNLLTNLATPVISAICVICELFQAPTVVIQGLKQAEEWCYQASGTKKAIDDFVNKVGDAIDETEKESDVL